MVNVTMTGMPDDCQYLGQIDVSKEIKLNELKDIIQGQFPFFQDTDYPPECMRIRQKLNTTFFGKIYKDPTGNKTLKSLGIKNSQAIVIQLLPEPELLDDKTIVLLLSKRDCDKKEYTAKQEVKFDFKTDGKQFPTLAPLKQLARQVYGLKDNESIELAKFIVHQFEWKHINGNEKVEQKKGKKGKTVEMINVSNMDLRVNPFFLQDGDIIGVRIESENKDNDDWQTESDKVAKAEFDLKRREREKEKAEEKKAKNRGNDNASITIKLD